MNTNKLPLWARDHINDLQRQVDAWEEFISQCGDGDGPVIYDPYGRKLQLPDNTVSFNFGTVGEIQVNIDNDKLLLRGIHGCLTLHPDAANTIRVETVWR